MKSIISFLLLILLISVSGGIKIVDTSKYTKKDTQSEFTQEYMNYCILVDSLNEHEKQKQNQVKKALKTYKNKIHKVSNLYDSVERDINKSKEDKICIND